MFILFCVAAKAQDKLYYLNGNLRTAKVLEITSEQIKIENENHEESTVWCGHILCIEFADGTVQKISPPKQNIIHTPQTAESSSKTNAEPNSPLNNRFSVNTLALCNSDVSLFYERMLFKNTLGVGAMGAFNFSSRAGLWNMRIQPLRDGRKNFDAGAFVNVYVDDLLPDDSHRFYIGAMFKYTGLSYTKEIRNTVMIGNIPSTVITLSPNKTGYQLATMLICGTYSEIAKNFYVKTMAGLGGLYMQKEYLQQRTMQSEVISSVLSAYLGLNVGFHF